MYTYGLHGRFRVCVRRGRAISRVFSRAFISWRLGLVHRWHDSRVNPAMLFIRVCPSGMKRLMHCHREGDISGACFHVSLYNG